MAAFTVGAPALLNGWDPRAQPLAGSRGGAPGLFLPLFRSWPPSKPPLWPARVRRMRWPGRYRRSRRCAAARTRGPGVRPGPVPGDGRRAIRAVRRVRRSHSVFAACSDCTAASCTSVPWLRPGRDAGVPAPRRRPAARPVPDGQARSRRGGVARRRRRDLVAPARRWRGAGRCAGAARWPGAAAAARAAASACSWARNSCGFGVSGGGASASFSVPAWPERMASSAPAICMPPGFSGFTRTGRLSASTTGTPAAVATADRPHRRPAAAAPRRCRRR